MKVFADPRIQVSPRFTDVQPRTTVTFVFVNNFRGETRRDGIIVAKSLAGFISAISRFNFDIAKIFV